MSPGRRLAAEVRREEILAATIEHVQRVGLASTRVADVANALGVSSGLLFYHFGTKDALVAEAFAYAVERDLAKLRRAIARGSDATDRLRRVLRLYGPTGSAVGWRLWIDAWGQTERAPLVHSVLREMNARWCAALREVVEDGVAEGSFTCADVNATLSRVLALLDGLSVAFLVYRSVTRAQIRQWVAEAVALELGVDGQALSTGR
jgi:AcrR family transcriptional regulator